MRRGFRAEWKAEIRGVLKGLATVWAGLAVFILLVPLLVVWGSGGFDAGEAGDGSMPETRQAAVGKARRRPRRSERRIGLKRRGRSRSGGRSWVRR